MILQPKIHNRFIIDLGNVIPVLAIEFEMLYFDNERKCNGYLVFDDYDWHVKKKTHVFKTHSAAEKYLLNESKPLNANQNK